MSENCIFCQIVKGELPCHLIDENEDFWLSSVFIQIPWA